MNVSRGPRELYAVFFDVDTDVSERWLDWYTRRHAPDLLAAGFLAFHAYRAPGSSPEFATLWEQDSNVLETPAYAEARAGDADLPSHEGHLRGLRKGVYRQLAGAEGRPPPTLDGRWLTVLGLEPAALDETALVGWLKTLQDGYARARAAVRLGAHPLLPETVPPRLLLVVESSAAPVPRDRIDPAVQQQFPDAPRDLLFSGHCYGRLGR